MSGLPDKTVQILTTSQQVRVFWNMINRINLKAAADNTIRAKAVIANGDYATTVNVATVNAKVSVYGTLTFSDELDGAITAFVTNDDQWTDDTNDDRTQKGYNFLWTMPASAVAQAGWYTVEIEIIDTGGNTTFMIFDGPASSNLTSMGLT